MAGIYIHIPFCHSKCAYCDFYSTPNLKDGAAVIEAIASELSMRSHEIDLPASTVYLGGGTPSILDVDQLRRIIDGIDLSQVVEFTIEANPEDVTADKVKAWRALGINRVSMGVQSLVDSELSLIGRRHSAEDAVRAVSILRDSGMSNISLDLIYALPTQTLDSWRYSLDGVLAMQPEHLSAYMLSYEHGTRLTAMLNSGRIIAVDESVAVEMYHMLTDEARSHGYEHYEISNFCRPGFRARHNSSYWSCVPYLGLGPSAHSFDGKVRRVNPSGIRIFVDKIKAGEVAYEVEQETRAERFNDLVITRLRTAEGLDFARVPVARRRQLLCDAYPYLLSGQMVICENHLIIPECHWLISDAILRDLMQ